MEDHAILGGFIEALREPALLVGGGSVLLSNAAARSLLGKHIDGQDLRLALRHPAAVERLLSKGSGTYEEVELVGIGEPNRRWTMSIATVGGERLLVRLSDRSEAHAAEQMRVDFVANASHELRTPLSTLVGYAETLRENEDLDAATRTRFLATIHDEALRMQRLVEDLISLSRIEAEKFTIPREPISLPDLVEQVIRGCRSRAEDLGCALELEVEPDVPTIVGDPIQIAQLVDNLLSNALRYGRRGRPVRIRIAAERRMVRLSVSDEGEGIPAEHIPRITERFYRVDPSRSRALGGTGLGMAIVKHIVERHRGQLRIESAVGQGTTFHVLLLGSGEEHEESAASDQGPF
ncbi:MAG TPA: ATP-binding protein [Allosphingosinicella sp.]|nr:ATP-binding protein [Allosphingosinicella sp.]